MAYGHLIWHLFLSYGSYVLITVGSYSNALKYKQPTITFIILFYIIPVVIWHSKDMKSESNTSFAINGNYNPQNVLSSHNTLIHYHWGLRKCFTELCAQYNDHNRTLNHPQVLNT